MILHNDLPFSSEIFFHFMWMAIVLVLIAKFLLRERVPFKWVMFIISTAYLALLYPKPLELLGLLLYLYFAIRALKKWYSSDNITFPMLLLAVPIILMKSSVFIPADTTSEAVLSMKGIIQIAGLSYIVFKAISLYIDERRNPKHVSFIDFYNFLAFVPTLLIGPLDRFKRFNTDIENGYANINKKEWGRAWNNLMIGLLFKFILADAIFRLVMLHLTNDGSLAYHAAYQYSYILYLFFDFAGYSALAIAFGQFMGIDVPINFNKPFTSKNPKEFWEKWHKSLGSWLGDYFFKPIFMYLTKKKIWKSIQRQNMALFMTFTLMGFWNGFELHFILSGILFGLYSVVHNYYLYRCKKAKKDVVFGNLSPKVVQVLSIFIMINIVTFSIYIFSGNLI